jgi:hypothetical protein
MAAIVVANRSLTAHQHFKQGGWPGTAVDQGLEVSMRGSDRADEVIIIMVLHDD